MAFLLSVINLHAANIQELSVPHEPSRILLSEDHRYLAVTHYKENLVSIINTETLEIEKQFESPNPGPMLSRGQTLYLSDAKNGLIKTYAQGSWEQQDELYAGANEIIQLSAPQANHFNDSILVSFTGMADNERFISLLDTKNDEFEVVRKDAVSRAVYSYTGEYILEQHKGEARMLTSSNYHPGSIDYLAEVDSNNRNSLFQVNDSDLWFSRTYITASASPEQLMKSVNGLVIPDSNAESETCYVLHKDGGHVAIHSLDSDFTKIQNIQFTDEAKNKVWMDTHGRNINSEQDGRAFAFSKSGIVTLFLIDTRDRLLAIRFALPNSSSTTGEDHYQKQLPPADSYTILKAPEGAEINDAGLLNWEPETSPAPGDYQFKVKLTTSDGIKFFRDHFSVTAQVSTTTKGFPRSIENDKLELYTDTAKGRLYVHTDSKLTILDAAGTSRVLEAPLQQAYQQILTTETDLVALDIDRVDFYELETLKLRKQVGLEGVKAFNMAYDPRRGHLYVGGFDEKESTGAKGYPLLLIDPNSGTLRKTERTLGQTVFISPYNDLMVTSISDTKFHQIGFNYLAQEINMLATYTLSNGTPELVDLSEGMVTAVSDIQFIPDGKHFITKAGSAAYGGQRIYQRSPIFKSDSLQKPVNFIDKKKGNTFGNVVSIAAHPKRDLIAILSSGQNDGAELPSLLDFRDLEGNQITQLISSSLQLNNHPIAVSFTPDGESLLLINRDSYGRRTVQKIPLNLDQSIPEFRTAGIQKQAIAPSSSVAPVHSTTAPATTRTPATTHNTADPHIGALAYWQARELTTPHSERMSPDFIGLVNMPAVVIISSEGQSIGTGFFISSEGHILTAAHVIPEFRNPQITCYFETSIFKTQFTLDAQVVDIDHKNDLALLKVDTSLAMRNVRLEKKPVYHGAPVYVIGHPGIGNVSLNYTMTNGIVSHPSQTYEDQNYLQISAPINPGNSGGPVFDDRGNVIGLVTSKFMMEGVSFAIPIERIMPFLSKNMDKSRMESPDKRTEYAIQQAANKEGSMTIGEVSFKNNIAYHRDTNRPINGTVVYGNNHGGIGIRMSFVNGRLVDNLQEYYGNGQLRHSIGFRGGIGHGESRSWYPSGNLMHVYHQQYNKMNGIERFYYDSPRKVKRMVTYRNGKKHGIAYMMNDAGYLVEQVIFDNDQAIKSTTYYPIGTQPENPFIEFIKAGDHQLVSEYPDLAKLASLPDNEGNYPIHIATQAGHTDMVKLLLESGANLNALDKEQQTALQIEQEKSNPNAKLIQLLKSSIR